MAEMSLATENTLTPENHSKKPPAAEGPASAERHESDQIRAETQSNELQTFKESACQSSESQDEDQRYTTEEVPVKAEPEDEEMRQVPIKEECTDVATLSDGKNQNQLQKNQIKEESGEGTTLSDGTNQNQHAEEKTLVGKVKIKPMASLVETNQPNPKPGVHPFFAGFDDHIRSLIINRQPQFAMSSSLSQSPVRFMYYDNSTNMNLKKMLNGHKLTHVPISRHPTYRPYVPINVPRPPRSQLPLRTSFSTQTPPMFTDSQPDVSATPSTSFQWLPQSRPPLPKMTPINNLPARNLILPKDFSIPNFTPKNNPPNPKFTPTTKSPNLNTPFSKLSTPSFPVPHNLIVKNEAPPQSNKVSTSSSTEDLENHSSQNNVIIKTEVDLDIDCKEELQATLNECNEMDTRFMDLPNSSSSDNVKLEIPDSERRPILAGDEISALGKEMLKPNVEFQLPAYSTKGPLLCKCCNFRCNRKKKMKEHFETMHTVENNFKCFYCLKNLNLLHHRTVLDLEHHVAKVHRGEKRWQCKSCSKTYKCRASYRAHVEKMCSQSHPYACHMCTFTCVTEASLEKHLKAHEKAQETQQCPFCSKMFKKFYLKQHLITVHAPPEEKPFQCMSCDFASGNQSVLENHYKKTGHDKKFKCDQCDYSCRKEYNKMIHVTKVHSKPENLNLICGVDGCSIKCANVRSLKNHRQIHSMPERELFTCPDKECSAKFATRQSLRFHTLKTKHHKPFKCPDCSLRYLKQESVDNHIQTIHVPIIMKRREREGNQEPICIKNVVDMFKYVEGLGGGSSHEMYKEEDRVANFGCWLGISGFGDITNKPDDQAPPQANTSEDCSQAKKIDEDEDEDEEYQSLVPITCLVEVKEDETEGLSSTSVGKTDCEESLGSVKEEEDVDDLEYQNVTPEVSFLVECQQNATMDSSTATSFQENEQEMDCSPANLVKIEVEERDVS